MLSYQAWQPSEKISRSIQGAGLPEVVIPQEDLIPADSREYNSQSRLFSRLGHNITVHTVHRRLVHCGKDLRKVFKEILAPQQDLLVVCAVVLRYQARVLRF